MDKIKKFLKKLSSKERSVVLEIIQKLETDDVEGLDIKKLSGYDKIFRIRVRDIRIIVIKHKQKFRLISIERRSDTTYRK